MKTENCKNCKRTLTSRAKGGYCAYCSYHNLKEFREYIDELNKNLDFEKLERKSDLELVKKSDLYRHVFPDVSEYNSLRYGNFRKVEDTILNYNEFKRYFDKGLIEVYGRKDA